MPCLHKEKVAALLERGGSNEEERWLDEHLETCADCAAEDESALAELRRRWLPPADDRTADAFLFSAFHQRVHEALVAQAADDGRDPFANLTFDPPRTKGLLGRLGPYDLVEKLGQGGFGAVYLAFDADANCRFAIKVLRPDLADDPEFLERFFREAHQANAVSSQFVVGVSRVGRKPEFGHPCLVMDYVQGKSLRDTAEKWTGDERRRNWRNSARMIQQLAEGLQAIHKQDVLHRDIKPANILLDGETGRPRLTDFGLAQKAVGPDEPQAADWGGTLPYMSPEQTRHGQSDARSDIYSLGVVLYELLVGERPFRADSPYALRRQILDDLPLPPRQRNDAIPRDLETITLKCLAKDPGRRYQTAAELAADLQRFLAGQPIQARPVSRAERVWLWCRRNRVLTALLILAVLAPATVAALLFVARQTEQSLRQEADRQQQRTEKAYRGRLDSLEFFADALITEVPLSPATEQMRARLEQTYLDHFRRELDKLDGKGSVYFADACATYGYYARAFGRMDEARSYYEQAAAVLALADNARHPLRIENESKVRLNLAEICYGLGRAEEAYRHLERAESLLEAGRRESPSRDTTELLAHVFRQRGTLRHRDRDWDQSLQDNALAERQFRELVQTKPDNADLLRELSGLKLNVGNVWRDRGKDYDQDAASCDRQAERAYREAVEFARRVVALRPAETTARNDLAESLNGLGVIAQQRNRLDESLAAYQESAKIRRDLVRQHAGDLDFLLGLGRTLNNLGRVLLQRRELPQSKAAFQEAIDCRERLVRLRPEVVEYKRNLTNTYLLTSDVAAAEKNWAEARRLVERGIACAQQAVDQAPDVVACARMLVTAQRNLSQIAVQQGDLDTALQSYQRALEGRQRIVDSPAATPADRLDIAADQRDIADVLARQQRRKEALAAYDLAIAVWKRAGGYSSYLAAAQALCSSAGLLDSEQDLTERRRRTKEALNMLQESVRAGLRDAEELQNPLFDIIRQEPGFQELLRQLQPVSRPR